MKLASELVIDAVDPGRSAARRDRRALRARTSGKREARRRQEAHRAAGVEADASSRPACSWSGRVGAALVLVAPRGCVRRSHRAELECIVLVPSRRAAVRDRHPLADARRALPSPSSCPGRTRGARHARGSRPASDDARDRAGAARAIAERPSGLRFQRVAARSTWLLDQSKRNGTCVAPSPARIFASTGRAWSSASSTPASTSPTPIFSTRREDPRRVDARSFRPPLGTCTPISRRNSGARTQTPCAVLTAARHRRDDRRHAAGRRPARSRSGTART